MKSTLIATTSGIRGIFGNGLGPKQIVRFTGAFAAWCIDRVDPDGPAPVVVVGRDARTTGEVCLSIVSAALRSAGCDVIDAGLATTPTVQLAVIKERATAGVMVSASHNPPEWNALKLFNGRGEYLLPSEMADVLDRARRNGESWEMFDGIGERTEFNYLEHHIARILDLEFIEPERIAEKRFRILVDAVNSVGGVAVPALLKSLGISPASIVCHNCEPNGLFARPAEPLAENLVETCVAVREAGCDLGVVVDPDVDRLALIDANGDYLSEELTQVVAADFMWRFRSGPFVTNLSSSRAIDDVAARYGMPVFRSPVGEINVVEKMREVSAVLGGEGNGGVILPEIHYGRDSLIGIAIVLQHLTNLGSTLAGLRAELPQYSIVKKHVELDGTDVEEVLKRVESEYRDEQLSTEDGLKIDFERGWVHLRRSNTEPIIRIYAEMPGEIEAIELADRFMSEIVALA